MKPKPSAITCRRGRRCWAAPRTILRTGEGRWRVDLMAARWAPGEDDFDRIDAIAEQPGAAAAQIVSG